MSLQFTLEPEDIQLLLGVYEKRREELVTAFNFAVAELDRKIDSLKNPPLQIPLIESAGPPPPPAAVLPRTESGRIKRGESERLVLKFLQDRNGTGSEVKDMVEAMGLKTGTVYRSLKRLHQAHYVRRYNDRWFAKRQTDLQAVNEVEEGEET